MNSSYGEYIKYFLFRHPSSKTFIGFGDRRVNPPPPEEGFFAWKFVIFQKKFRSAPICTPTLLIINGLKNSKFCLQSGHFWKRKDPLGFYRHLRAPKIEFFRNTSISGYKLVWRCDLSLLLNEQIYYIFSLFCRVSRWAAEEAEPCRSPVSDCREYCEDQCE